MRNLTVTTYLKKANQAFRDGRFAEAILHYESVLSEWPGFEPNIRLNLLLTKKRLARATDSNATLAFCDRLQPRCDVEPDSQKLNFWRSTGEDPYFEFVLDEPLAAGYYQFDLLIESSLLKNYAKFYVDYGQGYTEENAYELPYKSDETVSRLVKFHRPVQALRFDPNEVACVFRVRLLNLVKLDQSEAIRKMLVWLAHAGSESAVTTPAALAGTFKAQATASGKPFIDSIFNAYKQRFVQAPGRGSYEDWMANIERPGLPSPAEVQRMLREFKDLPLISVAVPTYNTDVMFLRACIDSVRKQSYPYWELCIADDASSKPHVKSILQEYEEVDPRIKVCYRSENGHISKASNSALELASGAWVALLDHDDELPEHALLYVVQAINRRHQAQIIYSDEDKLDAEGQRVEPHFKSDWNPDLFYSQNYVSHLGVYRRALLQRIGGFRSGVEGSQDQDLLLRCLPYVRGQDIVHIPKVLYHWRIVAGSTAMGSGEKSYTTEAGIRALRDYFATVNPDVGIEAGILPNTYRVRWPLPDPAPLVSLLIPTRDHWKLTETCVRSILDKTTYTNYEILILDNGSVEPESLSFFKQIQREDRRVRVLRYDYPFNYSAVNNFGVRHAQGEIIGLVNNDIEVISPEWLSEMVSHAVRPDIGCVGAKLYYSNDTIQHAGVICSIRGVAGHSHKHFSRSHSGYFSRLFLTQTLSAVTAACLLVRRCVFDEVNGLDEDHLRVAFNDVDFCLKVREVGYRNLWTPYAELYHHESISRGLEDTYEKKNRFRKEVEFMQKKWGDVLKVDPFYSPNLTNEREDFSI